MSTQFRNTAKAAECQEIAKTAWEIQDASNLRAVVKEMSKAIMALNALGYYAHNLNCHPIIIAYTSKIMSLARMESQTEAGRSIHEQGMSDCLSLYVGDDVEYEVIP